MPIHPTRTVRPNATRPMVLPKPHLILAAKAHCAVQQYCGVRGHLHAVPGQLVAPVQQLPHKFLPYATGPWRHSLRIHLVGGFVRQDGAKVLGARGFGGGLVVESVHGGVGVGSIQALLGGRRRGGSTWAKSA